MARALPIRSFPVGVDPALRGAGVGTALTQACIALAREHGCRKMVLHTTLPMQVAWANNEPLGFVRSPDLDFAQGKLPVFGFHLALPPAPGSGGPAGACVRCRQHLPRLCTLHPSTPNGRWGR